MKTETNTAMKDLKEVFESVYLEEADEDEAVEEHISFENFCPRICSHFLQSLWPC